MQQHMHDVKCLHGRGAATAQVLVKRQQRLTSGHASSAAAEQAAGSKSTSSKAAATAAAPPLRRHCRRMVWRRVTRFQNAGLMIGSARDAAPGCAASRERTGHKKPGLGRASNADDESPSGAQSVAACSPPHAAGGPPAPPPLPLLRSLLHLPQSLQLRAHWHALLPSHLHGRPGLRRRGRRGIGKKSQGHEQEWRAYLVQVHECGTAVRNSSAFADKWRRKGGIECVPFIAGASVLPEHAVYHMQPSSQQSTG